MVLFFLEINVPMYLIGIWMFQMLSMSLIRFCLGESRKRFLFRKKMDFSIKFRFSWLPFLFSKPLTWRYWPFCFFASMCVYSMKPGLHRQPPVSCLPTLSGYWLAFHTGCLNLLVIMVVSMSYILVSRSPFECPFYLLLHSVFICTSLYHCSLQSLIISKSL